MKNLIIVIGIALLGCTSKDNATSSDVDSTALLALPPADSTDNSDAGFDLMSNEEFGGLKIGSSPTEVTTLFGDPTKKSPVTFSEADGMNWQTWFYPEKGMVISSYQNNDSTWSVGSYLLTEKSTLKSLRNIGIGSTTYAVKQAYQKEITTDEGPGQIVAGTIYGSIVFWLTEDGNVRNIFVGASAE